MEGRPTICSQVLQPSNTASHAAPVHTPAWQRHPVHAHDQMQPSISMHISENSPVIYNYPFASSTTHRLPCFPGHGHRVTENMQIYNHQHPRLLLEFIRFSQGLAR